jgi:hypothetical protein
MIEHNLFHSPHVFFTNAKLPLPVLVAHQGNLDKTDARRKQNRGAGIAGSTSGSVLAMADLTAEEIAKFFGEEPIGRKRYDKAKKQRSTPPPVAPTPRLRQKRHRQMPSSNPNESRNHEVRGENQWTRLSHP